MVSNMLSLLSNTSPITLGDTLIEGAFQKKAPNNQYQGILTEGKANAFPNNQYQGILTERKSKVFNQPISILTERRYKK